MFKKFTLIALFTLFISGGIMSTVRAQANEDELKAAVASLCDILAKGDRVAFEQALHPDVRASQMQWWWDSSGKGKDFVNLFGSCKYEHLDPKSTAEQPKVFVQRYNKDGTTWGRPAPVSFKKDSEGKWKIVSYSL